MKKQFLVTMIATVAGCLVLAAQDAGPGPGAPPPPPRGMAGAGPIGMEMHPGKTVTGAAYSADVTTTVNQTLADGNTINRTTHGHAARDSQGRTYAQQDISGGPWAQKGPTTIIFITDPVAGYSYVLHPNTKTATRRELHKPPAGSTPPAPPKDGRPRPDNGDRVTADLGTQTIEGVNCTGKSITRTIPAGAIGNAQPIVDKTEIWTSPELQVVILSKRSDPRTGQSTYALSNIQRSEPDASLFQVPSDYKIQDGGWGPRGRHNR